MLLSKVLPSSVAERGRKRVGLLIVIAVGAFEASNGRDCSVSVVALLFNWAFFRGLASSFSKARGESEGVLPPLPVRGDLQNDDRGLLDSPLPMFLSSPTCRASLGTIAGDELVLVNVTVASLLGVRVVGVVVSVAIIFVVSTSLIGRVIICGVFLFSGKELSAVSCVLLCASEF